MDDDNQGVQEGIVGADREAYERLVLKSIEDLSGRVDDRMDRMEDRIGKVQDSVTGMAETMGEVKGCVESLKTAHADLSLRVTAIDGRVKTLETTDTQRGVYKLFGSKAGSAVMTVLLAVVTAALMMLMGLK